MRAVNSSVQAHRQSQQKYFPKRDLHWIAFWVGESNSKGEHVNTSTAGSFRLARQTNIAPNTYRDVLGWTNTDCGYGKELDLAGKDLSLTVSEISLEQRAAKQRPELSPRRGFASLGLRRNNCPEPRSGRPELRVTSKTIVRWSPLRDRKQNLLQR